MRSRLKRRHSLQGLLKHKWLLLAAVAVVMALVYWRVRDVAMLEYLATHEAALRQWRTDRPLLVLVVAVAIYTVVAGLSLPVAASMSILCGWYFGFWQGLLVASLGSTAGAAIAMLIVRYLFRDWAQAKMADRLRPIDLALRRDGPYYLFTVRLLPAIPYFVVNAVMGLTPMSLWTFWWVSQLGMLPGTTIHVYAGSTVPTLGELAAQGIGSILNWRLLLALALLGLFPLLVKKTLAAFTAAAPQDPADPTAASEPRRR